MTGAIRYERFRLSVGKGLLTLRLVGEDERFVRGYEVDAHGEEISGTSFDRRLHIIEKDTIVRRTKLRMNTTYAMLEKDE